VDEHKLRKSVFEGIEIRLRSRCQLGLSLLTPWERFLRYSRKVKKDVVATRS
jgi:hypothetical protein